MLCAQSFQLAAVHSQTCSEVIPLCFHFGLGFGVLLGALCKLGLDHRNLPFGVFCPPTNERDAFPELCERLEGGCLSQKTATAHPVISAAILSELPFNGAHSCEKLIHKLWNLAMRRWLRGTQACYFFQFCFELWPKQVVQSVKLGI